MLPVRTKSVYPTLWLALIVLVLVSVVLVYIYYQCELDRIERDIQDVKRTTTMD